MPVQNQSWTLVIICYNEMATLKRVVDSARPVLRKMAPGRYEIIIVDDGSVDGTRPLILKLVKKYPEIRSIHHSLNLGIGMALRSGYFNSKYENVCVIPGDGQFNVEELLPFTTIKRGTFVSFFRKKQEGYTLYF
jgi:glycosyltransferase involved in cell wall biosynthesis